MITGMQIRASESCASVAQPRFSQRVPRVECKLIKRLEATDGVPLGRSKTLQEVQLALETGRHRVHWHAVGPARDPILEFVN